MTNGWPPLSKARNSDHEPWGRAIGCCTALLRNRTSRHGQLRPPASSTAYHTPLTIVDGLLGTLPNSQTIGSLVSHPPFPMWEFSNSQSSSTLGWTFEVGDCTQANLSCTVSLGPIRFHFSKCNRPSRALLRVACYLPCSSICWFQYTPTVHCTVCVRPSQ